MNSKPTMLSEHFSLQEFTSSATAERFHINNMPDTEAIKRLRCLCKEVLEPLRKQFGPIYINSGYRCLRLNTKLKGVGNSQHMRGEAADIRLSDNDTGRAYFCFIRQHCPFDQLLFEHSRYGRQWLHVSLRSEEEPNRHIAIANYRV